MPTYEAKFDTYIEKAQPFARPILTHLRKVVHAAVPEVQENWKWGNPALDYKGVFCSMAASKQHCTFGFWKHELLVNRGVIKPDHPGLGYSHKLTSIDETRRLAQAVEWMAQGKPRNWKYM